MLSEAEDMGVDLVHAQPLRCASRPAKLPFLLVLDTRVRGHQLARNKIASSHAAGEHGRLCWRFLMDGRPAARHRCRQLQQGRGILLVCRMRNRHRRPVLISHCTSAGLALLLEGSRGGSKQCVCSVLFRELATRPAWQPHLR